MSPVGEGERRTNEGEPGPPRPRFPGFVYPLLGLAFGAVLVWSFSRILLAVDQTQAAAIALLMALNVLIGGALVAYGRRVRRRPVAFPLLVLAAVALVAMGTVSAIAFGDRAPEKEATGGGPPPQQTVTLVAKDVAFDQKQLTLTAGVPVAMTFDNQDSGVPHDFVLFDGPDASAPTIFDGPLVTGPATTTYRFRVSDPGSYFFHCRVHPIPAMSGTVIVGPAPENPPPGGGPSGGPPGPVAIAARNTAFSPTEVHVPGGGQITIRFDNQDANTPHNIAVFQGQDATAPRIFTGDLVTGPKAVDYTFASPAAGTYFFHCDVHPAQMTGTITVSG